jgi:AraC-like DNA-binding protein
VPYRERSPSAALAPYVEAYWAIDAPAGAPAHRVLPDGCMDLLFDASGGRVVGAMTGAVVVPPLPRGALLFGVRFHPGEAAPLLGLTAREIRDRAVAIEDVWGPLGRSLSDAVASARSGEARVRAVERVLLARAGARRTVRGEDLAVARVRAAVAALRASAGAVPVEALALRIDAAPRTLERTFDERVGVGPKLLARVVRLQRLVAEIDRAAAPWSALAAALSFADQAHLVREVGQLAGTTPQDLLGERRAVADLFNPGRSVAATVPPSPALPARRKEKP